MSVWSVQTGQQTGRQKSTPLRRQRQGFFSKSDRAHEGKVSCKILPFKTVFAEFREKDSEPRRTRRTEGGSCELSRVYAVERSRRGNEAGGRRLMKPQPRYLGCYLVSEDSTASLRLKLEAKIGNLISNSKLNPRFVALGFAKLRVLRG